MEAVTLDTAAKGVKICIEEANTQDGCLGKPNFKTLGRGGRQPRTLRTSDNDKGGKPGGTFLKNLVQPFITECFLAASFRSELFLEYLL